MLVAGIVLLVLAAGAAVFAVTRRRMLRDLLSTQTSTAAELAELAQSVEAEAGAGSFRERCEVVGAAAAGQDALRAPFSDQPCVWYRARITHRYWEHERQGTGANARTRRVERSKVVSDESSEAPFLLDDGTGRVAVDPRGAAVDDPPQTFERFEQDLGGGGASISIKGLRIDLGTSGGGTLGYQREEWALRAGQRLYVLGEATLDGETVRLSRPAQQGRFLISCRSEEELARSARRALRLAAGGAVVLAAAGLVLLVLGAV